MGFGVLLGGSVPTPLTLSRGRQILGLAALAGLDTLSHLFTSANDHRPQLLNHLVEGFGLGAKLLATGRGLLGVGRNLLK